MTKHEKTLKIIAEIRNSHSKMRNIFTKGSCYNLYSILKAIFPEAIAYSNIDHIITRIDDIYYDINGIANNKGYMKWKYLHPRKTRIKLAKEMYNDEYKIKNPEQK